jgi:hypothetical protein
MELTAERLRELLDYDPETGVFRWKMNRRRGKVAGTLRPDGYRQIGIDGVCIWSIASHGCTSTANGRLTRLTTGTASAPAIRWRTCARRPGHRISPTVLVRDRLPGSRVCPLTAKSGGREFASKGTTFSWATSTPLMTPVPPIGRLRRSIVASSPALLKDYSHANW